jgi:MoaA/NifB/PqqE/SkfB family radical SAM enzyme
MNVHTALKVLGRANNQEDLDSVIFFVTSICNAKCKTCFYWENLNQRGDLTFDEIERITRSMPKFRGLLLSGGEPTLRKDLVDVVGLFVRHNGIQNLSLPTNGLLPARVAEMTAGFLELTPDLGVSLGISVDGPQEIHDEIRGVPRNYERAIETLERVMALRDEVGPRLNVNVTTVVCSRNVREIPEFAEHLFGKYDLDMHNLVLIRGEPMVKDLLIGDHSTMNDFRRYHDALILRYHERRAGKGRASRSWLGRVWSRGFALESQAITYNNFSEGEAWPFACLAGKIVGVIDWNGAVRSCELRPPVANLREYDYDFQRLWNGPEMRKELESIVKDRCFCTHGCFLQPSLAHNRISSLVKAPLRALAQSGRRFFG